MSSIKSTTIGIAICFLGLTACENGKATSNEKSQDKTPQAFSEILGKKITMDFNGTVVDTDKNPLENVTITIGNKNIMTDSIGNFTIKDTNVNANFAYLEARKDGFKDTALNIVPSEITKKMQVTLHSIDEQCLFWFCKHNYLLPD